MNKRIAICAFFLFGCKMSVTDPPNICANDLDCPTPEAAVTKTCARWVCTGTRVKMDDPAIPLGCEQKRTPPGEGCNDGTGTCNDGGECVPSPCTGTHDDTSDATCLGGSNLECDDNDPCTIDICTPHGGCMHEQIPNSMTCGLGVCVAGICCIKQ